MACNNILANFPLKTTSVILNHVQRRFMPVNVPPTATGKRRFRFPVETDAHKLVNYCCGLNYHKDEPLIPLKPESEYPDWLWELRTGPKPKSWELDPNTKEYWITLGLEKKDKNYRTKMAAAKPSKVVDKNLLNQHEYLHRLRFAALAHMEDDAGLEQGTTEQDWWCTKRTKHKARDFYLPMNENRVLYMDKIAGNIALKNYRRGEDWTFRTRLPNTQPPPKTQRKAIQDSRRRHFYAAT